MEPEFISDMLQTLIFRMSIDSDVLEAFGFDDRQQTGKKRIVQMHPLILARDGHTMNRNIIIRLVFPFSGIDSLIIFVRSFNQ